MLKGWREEEVPRWKRLRLLNLITQLCGSASLGQLFTWKRVRCDPEVSDPH
jgi:hypothetical protein